MIMMCTGEFEDHQPACQVPWLLHVSMMSLLLYFQSASLRVVPWTFLLGLCSRFSQLLPCCCLDEGNIKVWPIPNKCIT